MRSSERSGLHGDKPGAGEGGEGEGGERKGAEGYAIKRAAKLARRDTTEIIAPGRYTRARNTPRSVLSIATEDDHRPEVDHVVYRDSRARARPPHHPP